MIAIPAVDLLEGRCVQLVGGRPDAERVSLPDPVEVAKGWRDLGFATLHVVDLDAALDRGENLDLVRRIAREAQGDLQVGGGIRDEERAADLLGAGAARVIVGTRAVDDRARLAGLAEAFPRRVIVAADVRDGQVLRRGWQEASKLRIETLLAEVAALPIAGVLCTDVNREGKVEGVDRAGVAAVVAATEQPVWISGGVTTIEELRYLREVGAEGAVLGMALYTGALDANAVAEEFGR